MNLTQAIGSITKSDFYKSNDANNIHWLDDAPVSILRVKNRMPAPPFLNDKGVSLRIALLTPFWSTEKPNSHMYILAHDVFGAGVRIQASLVFDHLL